VAGQKLGARSSFGDQHNDTNVVHLEAQLTGQPAFPVFANARDRFFYMAVEAQLDFERDGEGKVVAVILHQNGRDIRAPRVAQR
jgi:hypothetical protein